MCVEISANVLSLFEYTRSRVSPEHIAEFSPNDPGYENYVRLWTDICRSGQIPDKNEVDIFEVIGLTSWRDPERCQSPERYREYRRFTTAVAVSLVHQGSDIELRRGTNYLARDLIVDTGLQQTEHFELVRKVLLETRDVAKNDGREPEYPFFTLAALILAQQAGEIEYSIELAEQLLKEDNSARQQMPWAAFDDRFLFGLTNYDQFNEEWFEYARRLNNPTGNEALEFVVEGLLEWS